MKITIELEVYGLETDQTELENKLSEFIDGWLREIGTYNWFEMKTTIHDDNDDLS